ncbi:unnamed protein product, partial [Laminaria digitata]
PGRATGVPRRAVQSPRRARGDGAAVGRPGGWARQHETHGVYPDAAGGRRGSPGAGDGGRGGRGVSGDSRGRRAGNGQGGGEDDANGGAVHSQGPARRVRSLLPGRRRRGRGRGRFRGGEGGCGSVGC